MQSIFGALLTAGYAAAAGAAIAASGKNITQSVQNELTKSFSSAADAAQQYPSAQASKIIAGAKPRSCKANTGRTWPGSSPC